ncbi:type VI secretion system baseplate subunit TssG [Cognatilysobacter bugurensis]|uniref:Type VI secretion system baseplate subunit TssG n=1 Tax=Cognatilysobacter bugurensis TaxID=543356 RepID=A0A918W8V8_9GAMM|nr:type VI secretion system baseplate subunit TssG [Lysobacter bugurensis]GHA82219.1 hypothetical protein GCM10007067_20200 [Lysobacter bugurensis]
MPSAQRRIDPGVAGQLLAEPHRFEFFQALRILETLYVRQGMRSADAVPARLRFRNSLSLGFPASEIEQLEAFDREGERLPHGAAADADTLDALGEVHITPAFTGLLGTAGALPRHYTEQIAHREHYERDRAARAFLDVFTTRAVALHYGAHKKYRLPLQYELDRRERFLPIVLALAGVGMPALRDRLVDGTADVFDQAIAHYAGGIGQRPVSAAFLERMLSDYFRVPVRVEQFVGAWYRVPAEQCTRLGVGNASLGSTALAGDRVWQRDLRMRLWFGPLDRDTFDSLLPGHDAALALTKWLTLLTGASLEYEVRLVLKPEHVRGVAMGGGARLGWDSYLCSQPASQPRSDTGYTLLTLT